MGRAWPTNEMNLIVQSNEKWRLTDSRRSGWTCLSLEGAYTTRHPRLNVTGDGRNSRISTGQTKHISYAERED